jgi:hypothetical protein
VVCGRVWYAKMRESDGPTLNEPQPTSSSRTGSGLRTPSAEMRGHILTYETLLELVTPLANEGRPSLIGASATSASVGSTQSIPTPCVITDTGSPRIRHSSPGACARSCSR